MTATGTAAHSVCPKCGQVRAPNASAPAWQCPACGIAYAKFGVPLRRLLTPPQASEATPHWSVDGSVWSLVLANLLALAIAVTQRWGAADLMLLYWAQSVIIGIANVARLLALDRFSTENFKINDQPVDPTPATKRRVAAFFTLHYGLFHGVYLAFLLGGQFGAVELTPWFWLCSASFGVNHLWSYRYNCASDRQGTPNIGTLMFTPYLRIIPMHLTILFGGMLDFAHARLQLLLFGALKTAADVAMHAVEHKRLARTAVAT